MLANAPRVLIGAPASSTGKTTVSCGLLQVLVDRSLHPMACKCGPDYIDPMFATRIIGAKARNIDLFFASENTARALLARSSRGCQITLIEGVMGYYDGVSVSDQASAWDIARATNTPAILVVDGRGRARSIAAEVKGFKEFRADSHIAGVIINRCSKALYPRLKDLIEQECGVKALGYLPELVDCVLESRHLGLVTADEVADLRQKTAALAVAVEETVDVDGIIALANTAPALEYEPLALPPANAQHPMIAVARDRAFCFYYADALDLLEELGAQLVEFSPLSDRAIPEGASALYLGGGYPELYAAQLSENESMRESVKRAVMGGMPLIAECGGFLYLHEGLEDQQGAVHQMVGLFNGNAYRTQKLSRFGYVTLEARKPGMFGPAGTRLPAHEFHYWDSGNAGVDFVAQKPQSQRSWMCAYTNGWVYAGFPHLYLPGAVDVAARFVEAAAAYGKRQGEAERP